MLLKLSVSLGQSTPAPCLPPELCLQASRTTITIWGGISAPLFSLFSFSGCRYFRYFSPLFTISNIHKRSCNYNQVRYLLHEKMPNCAHTKNRNIQLQCSYISIQSSSNMAPDLLAALVRAKYNMRDDL